MGEGTVVKCPHCGYEILYMEGIGMCYAPHNFENPPSIKPNMWNVVVSKRILQEVEDIIKNKNGKLIEENEICIDECGDEETILSYGYRFFVSPKTNIVYNLFDFSLEYFDDGVRKVYKPKYMDRTKSELEKIEMDEIDFYKHKCPKCRKTFKNEFLFSTFIMWD